MRKNGTCEGFKWQNFQALDILLMKKRHIWTERRMDPCRRPYLTWPKSFRQLLYFLKKWSFYFTGSAFLPLLFYQECWEIRKFIALILLVGFAGSFIFRISHWLLQVLLQQETALASLLLLVFSNGVNFLPRCFNLSQMSKY